MEALRRWFSHLLLCINLKTLKKQQQSFDDIPSEIIDNIMSRLPVKSILKLRSVSKPWLSRISEPSFINLHLTHATTALFIPAVDRHTGKLFFLSATGSSLTLFMTLDRLPYNMVNGAEHVTGLVFLNTEGACLNSYEAIVVNPSTRKVFKLPYRSEYFNYFFGFDESTNQHKVLWMRGVGLTTTIELMALSLSDHKRRKVDASFDIGKKNLCSSEISSVCVNSVMYWLIPRTFEVFAFDFRTNTFSIVKLPLDDMRYDLTKRFYGYDLYFIKINGCVGIVCSHRVVNANEMHIWILQDFENHVWVKETITIPESWDAYDCPMPLDCTNAGEIIFSVRKLSLNVISVPIYNIKSRCFRSVQFTLDHPLLCARDVYFFQIKCYVESLMPL